MKKFNRNKILSLVLAFNIAFVTKYSLQVFFKMHPEYFYNLKNSTDTYVLDDDSFDCLDTLPISNSMVPQGIALSDEYTYVSMYDSLGFRNSIICVLDKECNLVNKVNLDCCSHVGGIACDEMNGLLWVSGPNGSVRAYDILDFLINDEVNAVYVNEDVGSDLFNHHGNRAVSYLSIEDNKLYVGNYKMYANGTMKIYEIKGGTDIDLEYCSEVTTPSKVQGVTFYSDNDNSYVLFARSCGTYNDSVIQVYKYSLDMDCNNDSYFTLMVDPMLEQIQFDDNGNLYSIYESNAATYSDGVKDYDYKVLDFDKVLKK